MLWITEWTWSHTIEYHYLVYLLRITLAIKPLRATIITIGIIVRYQSLIIFFIASS